MVKMVRVRRDFQDWPVRTWDVNALSFGWVESDQLAFCCETDRKGKAAFSGHLSFTDILQRFFSNNFRFGTKRELSAIPFRGHLSLVTVDSLSTKRYTVLRYVT